MKRLLSWRAPALSMMVFLLMIGIWHALTLPKAMLVTAESEYAALVGTDFTTYDFSSAFDLDKIFGIAGAPQLTVNVANFTNATLRSYFQFENATFTQYKPGRQFLIGLRGTF